jgi:recombinational DNA repair ATPase RecF
MDDALLTSVVELLDQRPLAGGAEALLLAALDDEAALGRIVAGETGAGPQSPPVAPHAPVAPAGAYLRSITVAGFRGIGPPTTLTLTPGPGLTVVCGRNGSGKSSFAEALEVLMTGDTRRWQNRSAVWKDTWRCVHSPATDITAELLIEGVNGGVRLRRNWKADDNRVGDALTTVQLPGQARTGIEALGWGDALVTHRPFLSHAELESLLAEPKELYGQLNNLLGLEDVDAALKRLGAARREADAGSKAAGKDLPGLLHAAAVAEDPRAARAAELLSAHTPDLEELRRLATGVAPVDAGPLEVLARLSTLAVPSREEVGAAAGELRAGLDHLDDVSATAAGSAVATADLLDAALRHAREHAGSDCPVCGTPGVIDDEWRSRTQDQVDRIREQGDDLRLARQRLDGAVRAAQALVAPAPAWLARAGEAGLDAGEVSAAWGRWADVPTGDEPGERRRLADHLTSTHADLERAVGSLAVAAKLQYERRQDRWAPLAATIGEWCGRAEGSAAAKVRFGELKAADEWLKAAAAGLRHERLRPFADRTVELWRQLRQSSNVDLVEVRLAGAGNRSHVDIAVTVDGQEASGLGVMSQGEINALALSVFLPRATMADSPFRFVVIDDPVQAMDPSKVDGLARVLAETAGERQVIVFTHDDRLPDSIRRLGLPATISQVMRRPDSVLEIHPAGDPCAAILGDAYKVVRDEHVPALVAAQVIPALCRTALEASCIDLARRRRLGRGDRHDDVEAAIARADKTMPRLALGVLDDATRAGEVYKWLRDRLGGWAADTVRQCQSGTHEGGGGADMEGLLADTRRLVKAIGAQSS